MMLLYKKALHFIFLSVFLLSTHLPNIQPYSHPESIKGSNKKMIGSLEDIQCGNWEWEYSPEFKDPRLLLEHYQEKNNQDCREEVHVINNTGIPIIIGEVVDTAVLSYSLELTARLTNARIEARFPYNISSPHYFSFQPLELVFDATPVDPRNEGSVVIEGRQTPESIAFDFAMYSIGIILGIAPCIPGDQAILIAIKHHSLFIPAVDLLSERKLLEGTKALEQAFNEFISKFLSEMKDGIITSCSEAMLETLITTLIANSAGILLQIIYYSAHVIADYYLYQDQPISLKLDYVPPKPKYTPSEPKPPIELPEDKPVTLPQISSDRNQVYLADQLLLDVLKDGPGCFSIDKILSPPTNNYFLVLMACFEGDNDGFLFSIDGKEKHAVTGKFDFINYSNVALSPDGKAFVYERINSCCHARSELPSNAPKPGIVLYEVSTHRKLVLVPDVFLTPMQWSSNSAWIAYFFNGTYDPGQKGKVYLVDTTGSQIWMLDDTLTGSDCSSFKWEYKDQSEDMILSCISSRDTVTKSYPVSGQTNTPPNDSAIRVK
jgi:hypothetical protein